MTQKINRLELAQKAHAAAVAKGFWDEEHSPEHYLMLVITELSEAVEAHRKGRHADRKNYDDSAQTTLNFERYIKDSVDDELADAYIRLLDLAGGFEYDVVLEGSELKDAEANFDEGVARYRSISFTEQIFDIVRSIGACIYNEGLETATPYLLYAIEGCAEVNGIDLAWHIEEKMKYNETRPSKHGKEY